MALNQFPRRSFVGSSTLQTFTGNGSTITYTLSSAQTQNEVFLYVDDVIQVPGTDFTVSGTTLTFTSAPANGAEIIIRGFGVPAPVTTVSDGSVTAAKLASGAIEAKLGYTPVSPTQLSNEVASLVDSAPSTLNTLNELAAALGDDPNYATTITTALGTKADTSYVNSQIAAIEVTPTQVSDQNNTSTGYFDLPAGTTAQRPVSPPSGATRYNTTNGSIEFFNGTSWISTNLIPSINSISGSIYPGISSSITLNVSSATDLITVRFIKNSTTLADIADVPVVSHIATVTTSAAVYNNINTGDTLVIAIINADGTLSSNTQSITVSSLPTGGTITTSSNYRIHTFSSSGTLSVPSGFSKSAEYLIVAGGGGGGNNNSGGGGAGGMLTGTTTISTNSYSVVVGSGGSGATSGGYTGINGSNSSALGFTAIGGGGGAGGNFGPNGSGDRRGYDGGSGGGGSRGSAVGSGTAGQGNGGAGSPNGSTGGGGGGKGAASSSQNGGTGASSSISGSSVFYAGGGGGSAEGGGNTSGLGGSGGGGRGGASNGATPASGWSNGGGENGQANTGGGGGGQDQPVEGANGGSGIVIIRYQI